MPKEEKKDAAFVLALGGPSKSKDEDFKDPMASDDDEDGDEYSEEKHEAAKDVAKAISDRDESAIASKLLSLIDLCSKRG